MKKFTFIFLYLIIRSACAQTSFQKMYGDTISNHGSYFIQPVDSGFYVLEEDYDIYNFQNSLHILKTTSVGDSVKSTTVSVNGPYYTCRNSKSNFVIATVYDSMLSVSQFLDTIYISKVDTSGNLLSQWKYPDTLSIYHMQVLETSDGGYLIAAGVWNFPNLSHVFLQKTDSTGAVQWKKTILPYTQSGQTILDMLETDDHFFIVEVEQQSGSNWTGQKVMLKVDTTGSVHWSTFLTYGAYGGFVHQLVATDTGYIYLDNIGYSMSSDYAPRISLVDTSGVLQWSILYPLGTPNYSEIIRNSQNEFYLCAAVAPLHTDIDFVITKLDSQLDSVASWIFGFPGADEYIKYLSCFPDGRIAALGYSRWNITSIQSDDIYFLVNDSLMTTGTGSVEEEYVLIYPNPTSGKCKLKFNDAEPKIDLQIYNLMGELISKNIESGKHEIQFDLTNYPAGIYIVQAVTSEKIYRGKVLKN